MGYCTSKPALGALHEHDETDQSREQREHADDQRRIDRASAGLLEYLNQEGRHARDDSGHDDQRNAVADAARGDLFAQPHQENRAAGERNHGGKPEREARRDHDRAPLFEADGDGVGLHRRQHHRAVARVLVDLLAPGLALFFELFKGRRNRRHQLNDDGGRDVGHDSQREDRHAPDGAAGQQIENIEQAALLLLDLARKFGRIDAGHRNIGAEPRHDQRQHREQDALLELRRLGEGGQIEIGG